MRPIPADEIKPTLATDPRWTANGLKFELDRTVVEVTDDSGRLRRVIDACDGRTTVSELTGRFGSEVGDLVEELLRRCALVDVEGRWRRFHWTSANPQSLERPISAAEAESLISETYTPSPVFGEPVALETLESHIGEIARLRHSASAGNEGRTLGWAELGTLLGVAYGRADSGRLTVPSGGALYPLVLHVLVRKPIGSLEPGIWWYDPWKGELHQTTSGRPDIEPLLVPHPVTDGIVARHEPILTVSAALDRPSRKYGARGYRFALMEAGAVMQAVYLAGAELGIPVWACAGYHDEGLNDLLAHPNGVVCMLLLFLGV